MSNRQYNQGFTFVGLLVIIAISGILLAAVGVVWKHDTQRTKEQDLLYYGDVYRQAITRYVNSTPSGGQQLPTTLKQLVVDARFPNVKRHIRTLYPNPMSQDHQWLLIKEQGRIKGVSTVSQGVPIKRSGFDARYKQFEKAKTYADWQFMYEDESIKLNASTSIK